jgi:hypothetical protein
LSGAPFRSFPYRIYSREQERWRESPSPGEVQHVLNHASKSVEWPLISHLGLDIFSLSDKATTSDVNAKRM